MGRGGGGGARIYNSDQGGKSCTQTTRRGFHAPCNAAFQGLFCLLIPTSRSGLVQMVQTGGEGCL